ncbi:sugar ABC transporter substrate-binding protein [Rhodococcus sp. 2H158]|uniref:sugar ABC transporter substrate-binding protein n=1 Tax=Rhodococcus aetherivorans TaxID=191292 RepID=UPI003661E99E
MTAKLGSTPEPGKTIVLMRCNATTCDNYDRAIKEAAAEVGWTARSIAYNLADPATLSSGLDTALQFHPAAVLVPGTEPEVWAASRKAYEQAGVPIIGLTLPTLEPSANPPIFNILGAPYLEAQGKAAADWFVADSNGSGKGLLLSIPAYPLYRTMTDSVKAEAAAKCPDCTLEDLEITIPMVSAQQIPQAVVSALRQDPSYTHIVTMDGRFLVGLSAQLKAAGLDNIRVGGTFARPDNAQEIKNGTIVALTNQSEEQQIWLAVDAALRMSQGMDLPTDLYQQLPAFQIVDKSNIDSLPDPFNTPQGYRENFKQLWLVE